MFELRVNIYSPLYEVYVRKVNRWECPPTRTTLYSFVSRVFKFYLWKLIKVAPIWLFATLAILYSVNVCYASLSKVNLSHELVEYMILLSIILVLLIPFILGALRGAKKYSKQILLQKWFIKYSYRIGGFGERIRETLTPMVRFVGHPSSENEIDRICP